MKELKFRVWDEVRKMWHIFTLGDLIRGVIGTYEIDSINADFKKVYKFTGKKDKNDVEIYKGDIVKAVATEKFSDESFVSDIICNEEGDIGRWEVRSSKDARHGLGISWGGWESLEVIGTVFENPELIKE